MILSFNCLLLYPSCSTRIIKIWCWRRNTQVSCEWRWE